MVVWLLLLHQIPSKPPYFRAKVLRRLTKVGALAIKNSAYLLPDSEETREDFEWICREITAQGGVAWLFRAETLAGLTNEQIETMFTNLRSADYQELIRDARALLEQESGPTDEARLLHQFENLKRIDFFGNTARTEFEILVNELKQRDQHDSRGEKETETGRVWVTRRGIRVDRIASAWLIQKFIDPVATFRFVDPLSYVHSGGEIRFDMYEGEFTHEGEMCTFEVLVARHALLSRYPSLQPIAEIVHDIDLKDERYERAETSGVARLIDGICGRLPADDSRLDEGKRLFDSLQLSFGDNFATKPSYDP
jgi:hypothetical protein